MRTTMITSMLSFPEMGCPRFVILFDIILWICNTRSLLNTRNAATDLSVFQFTYHLDLLKSYLRRIKCYDLEGDQIVSFYETPKLPLITLVFEYVCHFVVPKGTKSK